MKYCVKTNIIEKEKKYSDKFNFIKNKIQKDKLNFDLIKFSDKNPVIGKYSINNEKNKNSNNSLFKEGSQYSKSNLENNISLNKIKNKSKYYKQNNNSQNKNILESDENKNINKMNQNREIFLDINNINASNLKLNEPVQTFRKSKESENNSKNNQEITKDKSIENLYSNNIIKNEAGNNIHEVNLNYVNNICFIY